MKEVDIPSMETRGTVAETSKRKLAYDWEKLDVDNVKDQQTEWLKLIRDSAAHLKTEGIDEGISKGTLAELMGKSGRIPDPLSSENRGAAYEWLTDIEMKLIDGIMPNEADKRFLKLVKNTHRIQGEASGIKGSEVGGSGIPGEGMPTPETQGYTPTEFGEQDKLAKITRIKEQLIQDALMKGYITEDQVMRLDDMFQRKAEETYLNQEKR